MTRRVDNNSFLYLSEFDYNAQDVNMMQKIDAQNKTKFEVFLFVLNGF